MGNSDFGEWGSLRSWRIAWQAEDAGGCLGPLLWGDAGGDSRLVLGTKAAVLGTPSSKAELSTPNPQMPQSWGQQLLGTGALWASAVTSNHHFQNLGEVLIRSVEPTGFRIKSKEPMGGPKLEICLSQGKAGTGRLLWEWEDQSVGLTGCGLGLQGEILPCYSISRGFAAVHCLPRGCFCGKNIEEFCSESFLRSFKQILLQCFQLLTLGRFAMWYNGWNGK